MEDEKIPDGGKEVAPVRMTYGSGGAYEKENPELLGRRRIYTDAREITEDNVIQVLQDALMVHECNREDMAYLLRYEKGVQPLKRKKVIRPDIDLRVVDNLANQVVTWKLGYHWGNPITYVQRSDRAPEGLSGDDAVTLLNQMNDAELAFAKDQELARYVEICGIGYQMVDLKRGPADSGSVFELVTLDPLSTFIVYRNDIRETKLMSVTYRELDNGERYFTCITKDRWYEVRNAVEFANDTKTDTWRPGPNTGVKNPLGRVPVVEFLRSYDRMGVFERQIPDMDALNVETSDFANSVAQNTQEIWWMNDADFPIDPATGEKKTPGTGQWLTTKTLPNGQRPMIQALSSAFDYAGVQENIVAKRNTILQKCYVPLQSDPGGGSTASAMSMSSGWAAAEAVAQAQENLTRAAKMEVAALELIAAQKSLYLPAGSPLAKLKVTDIQPKFTRQKTFDLGTKVNAMVTMIKNGVHGRIAMETVDLFPDVAQAWEESRELVEEYQDKLFTEAVPADDGRMMSDYTDQGSNSPILDGQKTGEAYEGGDA